MKKIYYMLPVALIAIACSTQEKHDEEIHEPAKSTIELPYTASVSSNVNSDVSDADLLVVLKSYKDWETGDIQSLRSAFGDSLAYSGWDGTEFNGPTNELLTKWSASRDSLSSVKIDMAVWTKNNFPDKNMKNITVWYTETDTYKDGTIKKGTWHDINEVIDGKIVWYAQYRRPVK